jgi:hemerythrin
MALLEWRAEFSVGVPEVDHEHQELINLINAAHAKLGEAGARHLVTDFLGEINARISAHFALEEKLMRDQSYDEYEDHKADHERLLDEIRDIMDAYEGQAGFDENAFGDRLGAWFTEHFRTKDARFHKQWG